MSEEQADIQAEAAGEVGGETLAPMERVRAGWRQMWQVPMLLVASGVLVGGVAYAIATGAPASKFGAALTGRRC
ncbi:MAG: hypothetical protein R3B49_04750 [Phycisphaerales bacterium]